MSSASNISISLVQQIHDLILLWLQLPDVASSVALVFTVPGGVFVLQCTGIRPSGMISLWLSRCSTISDLPAGFSIRPVALLQSSLEFPFSQGQTELRHQPGQGRISPCGAGGIVLHVNTCKACQCFKALSLSGPWVESWRKWISDACRAICLIS